MARHKIIEGHGVDYQLKGKLAYVSAGAHGIGEAIADLLTQEGADVIVADADADVLREKAAKVARHDRRGSGDRGRRRSRRRRTRSQQFGRAPDILINNLGVGNSTPFEDISDEMWARSFEVNLMGTVRTCRALVPKMAARGSGSVVNTGSDLAKQPEPGFMDYGTCKAGLLYLTQGAREAVRADRARQHGAAGPDLVADVDEAGRYRRSARRALRARSRRVGEAVSRRSADADGHRQP